MSSQQVSAQERRENAEPREGRSGVPALMYLAIAAAIALGGTYITVDLVAIPPALGDQRTLDDLMPASVSASSSAKEASSTVDGAAIYAARCAACHQATGAGLPGVFPPLAGSEWVTGKEDLIAMILLHGVSGSLTVSGVKYSGAMPAFKSQLNDAEIAAVATHLRTQWGNQASAVTAEAVSRARADTAARDKPWNGDSELETLK